MLRRNDFQDRVFIMYASVENHPHFENNLEKLRTTIAGQANARAIARRCPYENMRLD